jgi:hypothetical protein
MPPKVPSWQELKNRFPYLISLSSRIARQVWAAIVYLGATTWKVIVPLSVLLGLFASVLFFLPRLSFDLDVSDVSDDPFPVAFVITNTNIVPLENVSVAIGVCYWRAGLTINVYETGIGQVKDCDVKPHNTLLVPPGWSGHRLAPDERYKLFLIDGFSSPKQIPLLRKDFKEADISIVVSFKPWIAPFRVTREARFRARVNDKNRVIWYNQTIDKP